MAYEHCSFQLGLVPGGTRMQPRWLNLFWFSTQLCPNCPMNCSWKLSNFVKLHYNETKKSTIHLPSRLFQCPTEYGEQRRRSHPLLFPLHILRWETYNIHESQDVLLNVPATVVAHHHLVSHHQRLHVALAAHRALERKLAATHMMRRRLESSLPPRRAFHWLLICGRWHKERHFF